MSAPALQYVAVDYRDDLLVDLTRFRADSDEAALRAATPELRLGEARVLVRLDAPEATGVAVHRWS